MSDQEAKLDDFTEDQERSEMPFAESSIKSSLDETSAGGTPTDWMLVRLRDLTVDTLYGANESAEDYDPDKPRYIRIKDIDEQGRLKEDEKASLSGEKAEGYLLSKGDMLFARCGSPGRTYLHRHNDGDYCYGGYSIRHELVSDGLNHEYLLQYTKSQKYWDWVERIARIGAQANINSKEYASLLVPLPSLEEQRKIASVLYTVDQAIQKTEEIIGKKTQVKQGLMNDLLSGEIRTNNMDIDINDAIQTDSDSNQLGDVAKSEIEETFDSSSWPEIPVGEVAEIVTGNNFPSEKYVEDGVPLIRISDIGPGIFSEQDLKHLPADELEKADDRLILEGEDILMAMSGATTGKVSRLPAQYTPALLNQRIAKFETCDEINHHFLFYCLQADDYQRYVSAFASGGAQDNISSYDLEKISIPYPSITEQRKIASILYNIDESVKQEQLYKEQLKCLKQGLMQDLLSGEVRTNDKDIEIVDEVLAHG